MSSQWSAAGDPADLDLISLLSFLQEILYSFLCSSVNPTPFLCDNGECNSPLLILKLFYNITPTFFVLFSPLSLLQGTQRGTFIHSFVPL
jgi:hypothetical protein